jgi:hypothetical protein
MLAGKKKRSQTLNTQSSQLTPTFKTGNKKEGKNCLLEPCLLGYEDYKEQLAYLHQCKQQDGGSNNNQKKK